MSHSGFTCRQSFVITLAPDSPICISAHDNGTVELHGYDYSDTFGTWGIVFRPEHLPRLEELVEQLRERAELEAFRKTRKNGTVA